ncbi:tail terminator [Mycobacterium phage EagleEye]|uniref:Tail terminator n=1 Tax=Mycobacterium phage EagleEye TaxID=1429759 RepID=W0LMN7_9CAUD|nr:tail terminator [Mycobacterium phage EagleEye]AHG23804.1 tail terminator [Mycobacterium phage EagleEye]QDK03459.1 tail terminator [Mycobacterium phage Lucyedi]QNJ55876.1 tail terminator [Mycobacterium phage PainterBoy]
MGVMPRAQDVVIPLLRGDPRLSGVEIVSWVPDIDYRSFPMINIRRIGGVRNPKAPTLHSSPVIEMTAYTDARNKSQGLIDCEDLYETALEVLYDCVQEQRTTPAGRLQSITETFGATQFSSLYQDSWRIQGLIRLSLRRPRNNL